MRGKTPKWPVSRVPSGLRTLKRVHAEFHFPDYHRSVRLALRHAGQAPDGQVPCAAAAAQETRHDGARTADVPPVADGLAGMHGAGASGVFRAGDGKRMGKQKPFRPQGGRFCAVQPATERHRHHRTRRQQSRRARTPGPGARRHAQAGRLRDLALCQLPHPAGAARRYRATAHATSRSEGKRPARLIARQAINRASALPAIRSQRSNWNSAVSTPPAARHTPAPPAPTACACRPPACRSIPQSSPG